MTEEPTSGTVVGDTGAGGLDARASEPAWEHEEYHGRPVSWVAVLIIIIGFILGGIALPIGPSWVLFWAPYLCCGSVPQVCTGDARHPRMEVGTSGRCSRRRQAARYFTTLGSFRF